MTTIRSTDALFEAITCARTHVLSERTNDVEQVMATVSQDVCYIMPDVTVENPPLVTLLDREKVRDFYAHERTFMEVVESSLLVELTSDWFVFLEAVSTTRQVKTGTNHQNHVVVLFPVADDGIIGEILASRRAWTDVYAGAPDPYVVESPADAALAVRRGRNWETHDRLLDALRAGDADAAAAQFSSDAEIAVRDPFSQGVGMITGVGGDVARRRCQELLDGIGDREITLLNRVVGEWYVFADWVVHGTARQGRVPGMADGTPVELRVASIYPLDDDGLFRAEQGYSLAITQRAPRGT